MITEQDEGNFKVTLVDFGLVTRYIKKGSHIPDDERSEHFNGCIQYADTDKLNFYATSRRDDFLSLFHMFVYLLNDN